MTDTLSHLSEPEGHPSTPPMMRSHSRVERVRTLILAIVATTGIGGCAIGPTEPYHQVRWPSHDRHYIPGERIELDFPLFKRKDHDDNRREEQEARRREEIRRYQIERAMRQREEFRKELLLRERLRREYRQNHDHHDRDDWRGGRRDNDRRR